MCGHHDHRHDEPAQMAYVWMRRTRQTGCSAAVWLPGEALTGKATLALLTAAEQDLYQDLVDGTFGPTVRLEQERVSFASVDRALSPT
jgi:hypothetical protein